MKVSIVTPAYNLKNYIEETAYSILHQTYENWEWIVVDDESSDNTVEILKRYNDPRIIIIESKHYGNLSILRNIGVKESNGELIAFVDGDDIWAETKLEKQVILHEKNGNVNWSFTNAYNYWGDFATQSPREVSYQLPSVIDSQEAIRTLLDINYICISSILITRKLFNEIGGFDEEFRYSEDKDLYLRLASNGHDLGFEHDHLLWYRNRKESLYHSKKLEYLHFNFVAYDKYRRHNQQLYKRYLPVIKKYYSRNYFSIACCQIVDQKSGVINNLMKSLFYKISIKNAFFMANYIFRPKRVKNYLMKKNKF